MVARICLQTELLNMHSMYTVYIKLHPQTMLIYLYVWQVAVWLWGEFIG